MKKSIGIFLVVFIFICAFLGCEYLGIFARNTQIKIENKESIASVAKKLKNAGAIKSSFLFKTYARGKTITPGIVNIEKNASYDQILNLLVTEKSSDAIKLTFMEACEVADIVKKLKDNALIEEDKFYDLCQNYDFGYDFLATAPKAKNRLEGFLFPDTYTFSISQDDELSIIKKMLERFCEVYAPLKHLESVTGRSTYEIITLASIAQREGATEEDLQIISGILDNRLKNKNYGYLQVCVSIQYVLPRKKPVLILSDTKIDSLYNTYKYPGLPPGPIACPGELAIKAALVPAKTNYYFFVSDNNRINHFSETYEQHLQYIKEYDIK